MTHFKETLILLACTLMLLCTISLLGSRLETVLSPAVDRSKKQPVVVIDAGHGGFDSGKVGVDGTLEKDVNLSISKKLQKLLEAADVKVIMSRTEDTGLYEETSTNKKRQDMFERASLMNEAGADCVVSIHQNSYPQEAIQGAQVFYYTGSTQGKTLAALIQKQLISGAAPANHRTEKSNNTYYLLKNVSSPIVIVECGFLSNWEESKKLVDDTYQQKLAWVIHLGILQYLNGVTINSHILR